MCGIAGIFCVRSNKEIDIANSVKKMSSIIAHRGPDGEGIWYDINKGIALAHRRLAIIDLSDKAFQPMIGCDGNIIVYNGEIYNYRELKKELENEWNFKSNSDTEVILASYYRWGESCINKLRGMFAFAIWDIKNERLFCARDRIGIKPFYYVWKNDVFYFSSEAKALIPFVDRIIDFEALKEYLFFQFYLEGKTLFKEIKELLPAHYLVIDKSGLKIQKYWEVYYDIDFYHTEKYFVEKLEEYFEDSIKYHVVSDVPVGAYLSGGIDSSLVALKARNYINYDLYVFHGKFSYSNSYDESFYAKEVSKYGGLKYFEIDISYKDFIENIRNVIYYLDFPVAGPGAFAQYMVSKLASNYRKVVLGGQGSDEIFGGYVRYLIAYFEQCIKAAIDGTLKNGNFVVTYESIIPNLGILKNYKSLIKKFWSDGLFEEMDKRYFRLINRLGEVSDEINWEIVGDYDPFGVFSRIFNSSNVGREAYFDKMTHFDFKTLLPALLHVEDRMSMANSVESRVPFLDHKLVEFAAKIPADIKFKDGELKRILLKTFSKNLPLVIINRKEKMGFPVPVVEWFKNELKPLLIDIFLNSPERDIINKKIILKKIDKEEQYGRKIWGFLALELWFQVFYDNFYYFKQLSDRRV